MGSTTYTFKEICEKTGYKPSVIRFYEKEFKLSIPRDINGRRLFTNKEYERLMFIKNMQSQGYTNGQIKKFFEEKKFEELKEIAVTCEIPNPQGGLITSQSGSTEIIKFIDEKLSEIKCDLQELNQTVSGKERDLLLSENLKLKMELKQKSYEMIEIKEKLRYERERSRGFFGKLFKKK